MEQLKLKNKYSKHCPQCKTYLTPATEWRFGTIKNKVRTRCRICERQNKIESRGLFEHNEERFKVRYAYSKRNNLIPSTLTPQELEQIIEFYLNCPIDHITWCPLESPLTFESLKYMSIEDYFKKKYSTHVQGAASGHYYPKTLLD